MISFTLLANGQVAKLEKEITALSRKLSNAVVPLFFWPAKFPPGPNDPQAGVSGAAFFVSKEGHFVTAAHVLDPSAAGQLSPIVYGDQNSNVSLRFEVVERDDVHDLALCKIMDFGGFLKLGPKFKTDVLQITSDPPDVGQFVLVSGFPLGSWKPAVQMGMIAATETVSPSVKGVPAGTRPLLQIDVAGNKGNSGGPVVSLRTGKVVGVIIQFVPAPIYVAEGVQINVPLAQSSGIMVAAPAEWIRALLEKHSVAKKKS